jgi:hypothetical protein
VPVALEVAGSSGTSAPFILPCRIRLREPSRRQPFSISARFFFSKILYRAGIRRSIHPLCRSENYSRLTGSSDDLLFDKSPFKIVQEINVSRDTFFGRLTRELLRMLIVLQKSPYKQKLLREKKDVREKY